MPLEQYKKFMKTALPLAALPIAYSMYHYSEQLRAKYILPEMLQVANASPLTSGILGALSAIALGASYTGLIAQEVLPNDEASLPTESDEQQSWVIVTKKISRLILSLFAAASNGLLFSYQNKEFNFELKNIDFYLAMGTVMLIEFLTALCGSDTTELKKLWRALIFSAGYDSINDSDINFPKCRTTASFISVYVPLLIFGYLTIVLEFYRNIAPTEIFSGKSLLFAACSAINVPSLFFGLNMGSKFLQASVEFTCDLNSILQLLAVLALTYFASAFDMVRAYEFYPLYIFVGLGLSAVIPANIMLIKSFKECVMRTVSEVPILQLCSNKIEHSMSNTIERLNRPSPLLPVRDF